MIIIVIVVILAFIIFLYKIYHDKLIFLNIKINCVEEKLKSSLLKQKELLKDSEILIKEILNTQKAIYENFDNEINNASDIIELDRTILIYVNEFELIKNKYETLNESDEFDKISFQISETNDQITSYKSYYNDVIEKYNKLIKKFPIIFTNIIKRRKRKLYFN